MVVATDQAGAISVAGLTGSILNSYGGDSLSIESGGAANNADYSGMVTIGQAVSTSLSITSMSSGGTSTSTLSSVSDPIRSAWEASGHDVEKFKTAISGNATATIALENITKAANQKYGGDLAKAFGELSPLADKAGLSLSDVSCFATGNMNGLSSRGKTFVDDLSTLAGGKDAAKIETVMEKLKDILKDTPNANEPNPMSLSQAAHAFSQAIKDPATDVATTLKKELLEAAFQSPGNFGNALVSALTKMTGPSGALIMADGQSVTNFIDPAAQGARLNSAGFGPTATESQINANFLLTEPAFVAQNGFDNWTSGRDCINIANDYAGSLISQGIEARVAIVSGGAGQQDHAVVLAKQSDGTWNRVDVSAAIQARDATGATINMADFTTKNVSTTKDVSGQNYEVVFDNKQIYSDNGQIHAYGQGGLSTDQVGSSRTTAEITAAWNATGTRVKNADGTLKEPAAYESQNMSAFCDSIRTRAGTAGAAAMAAAGGGTTVTGVTAGGAAFIDELTDGVREISQLPMIDTTFFGKSGAMLLLQTELQLMKDLIAAITAIMKLLNDVRSQAIQTTTSNLGKI